MLVYVQLNPAVTEVKRHVVVVGGFQLFPKEGMKNRLIGGDYNFISILVRYLLLMDPFKRGATAFAIACCLS